MPRVFAEPLRKPAIPLERFVSRSAPMDALCINCFLNVETIHLTQKERRVHAATLLNDEWLPPEGGVPGAMTKCARQFHHA